MLFGFSATVTAKDQVPATVDCNVQFNLKGWPVFNKTAEGSARVTCNNGEHAKVNINVIGGGLAELNQHCVF